VSATGTERQLVVVSLHGEHYGLPIACVREITRYTPPGATAVAHGLVRGMISWRGGVLPVADLSTRLGGSIEVTDSTRILVLELARGSLGLIVDAVVGMQLVPEAQIAPLPVAAGTDLGDQVVAVGERLVVLIDPERALGAALPDTSPPPSTTAPRRRKTTPREPAAKKAPVSRRRRSSSDSRPPGK
jgi:chemotaxis signal transduction protein